MTVRPRKPSAAAAAVGLVLGLGAAATSLEDECYDYDGDVRVIEAVQLGIRTESAEFGFDTAQVDAFLDARRAEGALIGAVESWDAGPEAWLVAWDEYAGPEDGFDVLCALVDDEGRGEARVLAGGPAFQARPSVTRVEDGPLHGLWIAWEEGPANWGRTYRSVDRLWNNVTDDAGPLHTWRVTRLARFDGETAREIEVPMPALAAAAKDPRRRPDAKRVGVFYERPRIDAAGPGLNLVVRHMLQTQCALDAPTTTHVESGYTVDGNTLLPGTGGEPGWGGRYRGSVEQHDGNQTVSFTIGGRPSLMYDVGRRDRREGLPGTDTAMLELPDPEEIRATAPAEWRGPARALGRAREPYRNDTARPTRRTGERTYTLAFGDLHRHTDYSLCFPFYDGSLDDAYRYARGPANLDFVGITDHARDLDRGNVNGVPWDVTVAAADRHHAPGRFVTFYTYERSQEQTDHNVISLVPGVLAPHTPPLAEFWDSIDPDTTFTIPHATSHVNGKRFCGDVWFRRDDARRPLAEVYQSYRDVDSFEELRTKAVGTGQRLGFIASSDHLSTSGAYACVWAEGDRARAIRRRPIFDALRARRTYGATARIELCVRTADGVWMGEAIEGPGPHRVEVEARGPAPVARVEFWTLAGLAFTAEAPGTSPDDLTRCSWEWSPKEGPDACFVVVHLQDGERAWASPLFHGDWTDATGD